MVLLLILPVVLWLAYVNGANDNFKGVATLYGSNTTSYRGALTWATAMTFLGSVASVALATGLLKSFSGGGIVPAELVKTPAFLLAVAIGGAGTIFAATLLGMPTSTTHALTGALVGAGLVADVHGVSWNGLGAKFFLPLVLSPVLAVAAGVALYGMLHAVRRAMGVSYTSCVCATAAMPVMAGETAARAMALPVVMTGETAACAADPAVVVNVPLKRGLDGVHFLSAGAVCFARALNDTPKIAALLVIAGTLSTWKLGAVAVVMAIGGLLGARKVATVMSKKIAGLNEGQGASASVVTAALVLAASVFGLPVSTTHVSVSAIFGIGLVTGQARWKTITHILIAWVTTLPAGLALGAAAYWLVTRL